MSISHSECMRRVGLNRNQPMPEIEYRWVGYSGGKVVECKSMMEAQQYTLHDRLSTEESVKRRDDFLKSNINKEKQAIEMFKESLRNDYLHLPQELYDVCYNEAYKRGFSIGGLDTVSETLVDVVAFAQKVFLATKEEEFH